WTGAVVNKLWPVGMLRFSSVTPRGSSPGPVTKRYTAIVDEPFTVPLMVTMSPMWAWGGEALSVSETPATAGAAMTSRAAVTRRKHTHRTGERSAFGT